MKNQRIYLVFFLILLAGLGITARIFYIQVIKGGYYSALARGQHADYKELTPPRGDIFLQDRFNSDSGLFLAATNKDWPMLYAVPKEIEDPALTARELASVLYGEEVGSDLSTEALRVWEEELYQRINSEDDPYEPIAHKLDEDVASYIEALGLKGVYIKGEQMRYYPAGDLASHILGFVGYRGNERVGQYGVESFYEDILRGSKGVSQIPFLRGSASPGGDFFAPGEDIVLSIDYNIQFMLEKILREAKENLEAEGASALVIDPKTGAVMALAVIDSFDPNNYSEVENIDIFLNGAVQKIFEPGSVFKPFTASAALNEGVITPTTKYNDTGSVTIGKYTIRNSDKESHGTQSMTNVLELSINTGVVFMERKLGHDDFRDYMKKFGFDERTGVDLAGEALGDVRNILETSRDVNFATASFGQGIAVTPIQLVAAFSAFANGGKRVMPHVVKEIISADGSRRSMDTEILGVPISSKTAAQMTAMLVSVVENGYGKKARVPGYKVAGKTGTAQVPKENGRGYHEDKSIHSFIGYAPAYDPRFLALIKLDNPQGINFSADSVAPLFSEIAEYILNYYEIPPDN